MPQQRAEQRLRALGAHLASPLALAVPAAVTASRAAAKAGDMLSKGQVYQHHSWREEAEHSPGEPLSPRRCSLRQGRFDRASRCPAPPP